MDALEDTIAQKTGETVHMPCTNGIELLVTAAADRVEYLFIDGSNGRVLAEKCYTRQRWAFSGISRTAAELGVTIGGVTPIEPQSPKSIWRTRTTDMTSVRIGDCDVELVVVSDTDEATVSFRFGGQTFEDTFPTTREAKAAGLAKLNGMAAWATTEPSAQPASEGPNHRRKAA